MIELKGTEVGRADHETADPRNQYEIVVEENVELKAGDEILLLVTRPSGLKHEGYGIPLRLTNNSEPDEDEFLVKYGDKLFVAQKIPEFI
ncbi:MAG TPA: hypothetical protein VFO63_18375 [Blastocatellia bacterium]|nr:hypothetical protein [Blastocatellia bacterium]